MKLNTKGSGNSDRWNFGSCVSAGNYREYQQYTQKCCQPPGTYTLTCKNYGWFMDGWEGGFIEIQGTKYCTQFTSGQIATKQVTIEGIHRCLKIYFKRDVNSTNIYYLNYPQYFSLSVGCTNKDTESNCNHYKSKGWCTSQSRHATKVRAQCQRTCNLCEGKSST